MELETGEKDTKKARPDMVRVGRQRFRFIALAFVFGFLLVAGRLISLGFDSAHAPQPGFYDISMTVHRPDILDRKGRLLATDIKSATLYADPKRVVNSDDLVEELATVLPHIDTAAIRRKINKGGRFVLIKRELSPIQEAKIHALGIPGLGFIREYRRFYPAGTVASHVLGFVNIDNQGLAGIEKFIDDNPQLAMAHPQTESGQEAVTLSIDLGVQQVLQDELQKAMKLYKAKAAGAVVIDVHSGEILGMASLPTYDPNHREQAVDPNNRDRMTANLYELGSIWKLMTIAACLDDGTATLNSIYDVTNPIHVGRFTINDDEGLHRPITVRQIFVHSSNIGAAKMAVQLGVPRHQAFLRKMGLLTPVSTEIGPIAPPLLPQHWTKVSTMTIAFGHGISVAPLQFAAATIPLVNGGIAIKPTFLPRSRAAGMASGHRVIKASTSRKIVELMRDNVLNGTGKNANAPGYRVGGKTGTAERVVNGRYAPNILINSFDATFPTDNPQYIVMVTLDEPKKVAATHFVRTASVNAAPTVGRIVSRIAPILGVQPKFSVETQLSENGKTGPQENAASTY